jgi:hypothetical protein
MCLKGKILAYAGILKKKNQNNNLDCAMCLFLKI